MDKEHVSFSELYKYYGCKFRHYLTYIEGNEEPKTIHLVFGNAVHDAIDAVKKGKSENSWITMGKTIYRWVKENPVHTYTNKKGEVVKEKLDPKELVGQSFGIFSEVFQWLDDTFPGYELIGSEIALYEPIPEDEDLKFKGFVDFFIKMGDEYHLIDFKTCGWGWNAQKRSDTHKQYQLTLYKDYLCRKMSIDPKKVKTHFVLLKRTPPKSKKDPEKLQSRVELVTITSGPRKIKNANAWVAKQVKGLKKGLRLKNRTGCKYCPFRHTKLCP